MTIADVLAGRHQWAIECTDVLTGLALLPDNSVQCAVTSPPYWSLRDYGVEEQLGLEASPQEYLEKMVTVFREVRRVLRPDATCWVNMGDSYSGSGKGRHATGLSSMNTGDKQWTNKGSVSGRIQRAQLRAGANDVPAKNLLMMPARLAIAMQADGWVLRSEIVWAKPAPMPESVTDRPTRAHEMVYLFAKQSKYFYDSEVVREPGATTAEEAASKWRSRRNGTAKGQQEGIYHAGQETAFSGEPNPAGRNSRSVWTIGPENFSGSHFAVFPTELVRRCVAAGTSERGCCPACGAAWKRVVERDAGTRLDGRRDVGGRTDGFTQPRWPVGVPRIEPSRATTGWTPTCACAAGEPVPCVVLDPFSGAGTTVLQARRMGRRAIGIELKPEYAEMARRRVINDCPLFERQEEVPA